MKVATAIITVMLILALFSSTVAAETANKNLPTKADVSSFLKSVGSSENFTKGNFVWEASGRSMNSHSTWKWDVWESKKTKDKFISFYYRSGKSYGSVYYNDKGKDVTGKICKAGNKMIASYIG